MAAHSPEQAIRGVPFENDDVVDAMPDGQRRRLLVDVLDSDPQHVSTLSEAARNPTRPHEAVLDQFLPEQVEIHRIDAERIQDHHVHLPELTEYGFRFDEVKPVLGPVKSHHKNRPPLTDTR